MKNSPVTNFGLLLLRVVFSGMLLTHGIPKLMKLVAGDLEFADPIGIGAPLSLVLAIFGEVIFPILVIIGFKTRWTVIPMILTMAVAAFIVHASDPMSTKELSILFLTAFISIALLGPGKYSIDKK